MGADPAPEASGSRVRIAALLALATGLCAFMAWTLVQVALHKRFWLDEGFELTQVCDRPALSMLVNGSHSCSPAPLFSMIERSVVSLEPLGLSMRIRYRAVSLFASGLVLLLLVVALGIRLGVVPALAAFSLLASDATFHNYAAENRSYMMWLLASVVLALAAGEYVRRGSPAARAALVGAGLLTGLAAIPGCLQVAAAFAACLLARRLLVPSGGWGGPARWALAAASLAVVALDGYYWTRSVCRDFKLAGHLDFLAASDRWQLLRDALAPFWPEAMTAWGGLAHAAVALGILAPLALWRRRESLDAGERHALGLALIAIGQALVAIPVTVSLARGGYFVLPRMFFFLMAARAILAAVGVFLVAGWIRRAVAPRLAAATAGLIGLCAALWTTGALITADTLGKGVRYPFPELGAVDCQALAGRELRALQPFTERLDLAPNFLVRLGMALETCGRVAGPEREPRYVVALDVGDDVVPWYRIAGEAPSGLVPATLCGRPVVVPPPR